MKEKALCVLCTILLLIAFEALGNATLNNRYIKESVIIKVEGQGINAKDNTGNVWYYEVEGNAVPAIGTHVVLTIQSNGSDTLYDGYVINMTQG